MTSRRNKSRDVGGRNNRGLKNKLPLGQNSEPAADSEERDIVIPVMGPTGAGKSTLINAALGRNAMAVGYEIESCTVDIAAAEVDTSQFLSAFPWLKNRRLLLVDTPGFDDTYVDDSEILERIAKWLENSYHTQVLGGILYLHDISIDRFTGTAKKNLNMFNRLCGQSALQKVILGATKSSRLVPNVASKRLARLKEAHWKDMIDKGAQVFEFDGTHTSALNLVKAILNGFGQAIALQIQHELGDKKLIIPETDAGKELRYTLQQALEHQICLAKLSGNAEEGDTDAEADLLEAKKRIEMLSKQLQQLKVPLSRRFLTFFGIQ